MTAKYQFKLMLEPVSPKKITEWSRWGYAGTGSSGILLLVKYLQRGIPVSLLERFPNYETFFWAAFILALLPTLFLKAAPKIIFLSLTQLGVLASFFYIAYAVSGIFIGQLLISFIILMGLMLLCMAVLLSEPLKYFKKFGTDLDVIVLIILFVGAFSICLYPLRYFV